MDLFNMDAGKLIYELALRIVPFLMAITVHEFSHGFVAYLLGDNTAKNAGRLTLNPIAHIDPIGLLCLLLTRMFGWAKPVPVNMAVVSRVKYGRLMVAAAGPLSNYILAVISAALLFIIFKTGLLAGSTKVATAMFGILYYSVVINVALGTFNLLPVLPLDGGRILENLLPRHIAYQYQKIEPYGMIIVILLLVTGVLRPVFFPLIATISGILTNPTLSLIF